MKKALIMWGGWEGHTPRQTAKVFADELKKKNFDVVVRNSLATLLRPKELSTYNLIVPMWTMGEMDGKAWRNLNAAVRSGIGFAGVHGGMCDSFRKNLEYQWMTGGQFMGHPHVGDYTVRRTGARSPITKGMPMSFPYTSEQYYMQVDPSIKVLAETTYKWDGQKIDMPVVWTKTWGKGRVFYSALGHQADEFTTYPDVLAMSVRGMLWAAK